MSNIDKELAEIEKGNAWKETDEVVRVQSGKPLDKVVPVRLPSETWEQLRKEAKELGIGPTTLARMWILERLNHKTFSQDVVIQTTESIIEQCKQQLGTILREQLSEGGYTTESKPQYEEQK